MLLHKMKGYQERNRKAREHGTRQARPRGPSLLPDEVVAAVLGQSAEELCQEGLDALPCQGAIVLLEAAQQAAAALAREPLVLECAREYLDAAR